MSWSLDLADGGLAPYLLLILFGFLPSEIWRWLSVGVARNVDEGSTLFVLARATNSGNDPLWVPGASRPT